MGDSAKDDSWHQLLMLLFYAKYKGDGVNLIIKLFFLT